MERSEKQRSCFHRCVNIDTEREETIWASETTHRRTFIEYFTFDSNMLHKYQCVPSSSFYKRKHFLQIDQRHAEAKLTLTPIHSKICPRGSRSHSKKNEREQTMHMTISIVRTSSLRDAELIGLDTRTHSRCCGQDVGPFLDKQRSNR